MILMKIDQKVFRTITAMLLLIGISLPLPAIAEQKIIFDGRSDAPTRKISDAESNSVQVAVTPGAKKKWKDYEAAFEIKSSCEGAFTQKGAKQIAYVYSWCETGHSLGISGIAIMEKEKLVAHFGWDGGGEYDVVRLPDINGDGLDELAIVAGSTNQGYTVSSIAIVGVQAGALKKFGRFQTYDDNSGAVEKNPMTVAWCITADLPAPKPIFTQQKFKQVKEAWIKSGKITICTPEKDEAIYEKL